MRRPNLVKFQPALEPVESRQLLSLGSVTGHAAQLKDAAEVSDRPATVIAKTVLSERDSATTTHALARHVSQDRARAESATATRPANSKVVVPHSFLVYRITNPSGSPVNLVPPFQQVLVQTAQPVPGQVYNVLYVAVKNETRQTFTASNGFEATVTGSRKLFPVLTGNETWQPGKWMVFYVLTKKYYPVPEVSGGFELFLGGQRSTLVPGPSGIFLRLTYDPAKFASTLDSIVAYGPGAEGGAGAKLGMPDTAINAMVAAQTSRIDFAGHF